MSLKYATIPDLDGYVNPWGCTNTLYEVSPNVNQAALQAQFPQSELRALVDGGGNLLILHLSTYPNTNLGWPNVDIQGNPVISLVDMMGSVSDLQPWILNPLCRIRITTGGLWYNANLTAAGSPNTTASAITKAAYLLAYGAQMGPAA